MKKDSYHKSILTERLSAKVVRNYEVSLIILLFLLFFILSPLLAKVSLHTQYNSSSYIKTQYQQMLSTEQSLIQMIHSDKDLVTLLRDYENSPQPIYNSEIEQKLQAFVATMPEIKYCMIERDDSRLFQSFSYKNGKPKDICISSTGYNHLRESQNSTYYSPILSEQIFASLTPDKKQYSMFVSKSFSIGQHSYILTVFFNVADYIDNCKSIMYNSLDEYIVIDNNRTIQFSTFKKKSSLSDVEQHIFDSYTEYADRTFTLSGAFYTEKVTTIGWYIVTYTNWLMILKDALLILIIVLVFFLLPLLLFYINIIPTNQKYLEPLSELNDKISHYSAGDDLVLNIHTGDEIEQLGSSINEMIQKINKQIEQIRKQEYENSVAHYSILATEIDPHFIYNTLSIINSMARKVNQNDIIAINTALSRILRERFNTKASIFETIQESLDTLQQYHTIMRYRYKNQVHILINAENEILAEKLPKNLLIPIVENSYYHGLCDDNGDITGEIEINIYRCSDDIVIEISDNGNGISPERLEYLKAHKFCSPDTDRTHIGLSNVYKRLHYIYQDNFSIDIGSDTGCGTTVSITLPIKPQNLP